VKNVKVFLSDAAGAEWELPPLLRWEVSHALCSPCDALEATVVFRQELLPVLRGAVRVRAEHGEETVFAARRRLARDLKILFDEKGITIPFPQVVVHQGD
jgi:hypothetical protein